MQKVHQLEIKAKKLSRESFAGEFHSSFRGQGLDFEDFREYHHGDETRFIDWNVTARMNTPFVRTFREERELSMIVAVDISGSSSYGSELLVKRELAAEITAVLAFAAKHNGNKVGLLLFSEHTELFLPAEKGGKHVLRIVREVLARPAEKTGTDIGAACSYLTHAVRKKSLIFVLSDFISPDYTKELGALSRRHDVIGVRLFDPAESNLPDAGTVTFTDSESGAQRVVNTSNTNVRMAYEKLNRRQAEGIEKIFKKYAIDNISASTTEDYLPALHKLFKMRASKHA